MFWNTSWLGVKRQVTYFPPLLCLHLSLWAPSGTGTLSKDTVEVTTLLCRTPPTDQSPSFVFVFLRRNLRQCNSLRACDQSWNGYFCVCVCEHPLKCWNNHQHDCVHLRKEEEYVHPAGFADLVSVLTIPTGCCCCGSSSSVQCRHTPLLPLLKRASFDPPPPPLVQRASFVTTPPHLLVLRASFVTPLPPPHTHLC